MLNRQQLVQVTFFQFLRVQCLPVKGGGGGVSGHKQKTQGMTKQTQGAHDTLKQTQETHGYQGPVRRSSFSELPRSFSG